MCSYQVKGPLNNRISGLWLQERNGTAQKALHMWHSLKPKPLISSNRFLEYTRNCRWLCYGHKLREGTFNVLASLTIIIWLTLSNVKFAFFLLVMPLIENKMKQTLHKEENVTSLWHIEIWEWSMVIWRSWSNLHDLQISNVSIHRYIFALSAERIGCKMSAFMGF